MIDIKTLHIGSHVLVDGKRERVRGLDEDNGEHWHKLVSVFGILICHRHDYEPKEEK